MTRLPEGFRKDLLLVLAAVAAAFAFLVWHLAYGRQLPFATSDTYQVRAIMPSASLLAPEARVTVAGLRVGKVTAVRRTGASAMVQMEIDRDELPRIPSDTRVALRQRTPLGENYVSMTLGNAASSVRQGTMIAAGAVDEAVDVDKILSVLQGSTRQRARDTLSGLGGALDAHGQELNDLLHGTGGLLSNGADFVRAVHPERETVAQLVRRLGELTAAVGERGAAISQIGGRGLISMRALASRDRALAALLHELPTTLRNVDRTTALMKDVSRSATPVVTDLTDVVRRARPVVARLTPAATQLRGVFTQLDRAAPALERVLRGATSASGPVSGAMPKLRDVFCQANPLLRYLKPYMPDLTSTIVGLGSASNSYDAIGHLIRLNPVSMNENTVSGLPAPVGLAAQKLLHSGLVSRVTGGTTFNPYPKPGEIGTAHAVEGEMIQGPEDLAKSGYTYPRTRPDC